MNGITFHDLRATFDTNMDRAGVSESCRRSIMGHTLRGMDAHYLRLSDEDLRGAMDRPTAWIDDHFRSVAQTVAQAIKSG